MRAKLFFPGLFLVFSILACIVPSTPTPGVGGIIQGVVYGDMNGDGVLADSEQISRVEGVEVTLTDCGTTQTQLTDSEGNFLFKYLPEGSCHLSAALVGWTFTGSFPSLGEYPIPVASDPKLPTALSIFLAPMLEQLPTSTNTLENPSVTPGNTPTSTSSNGTPMVTPIGEDVNCRFGPAISFMTTGSLRIGEEVQILGTINDNSWWQIKDPREINSLCWVKASLTKTSGNISSVPKLPVPSGLVTNVTVIVNPPLVHGYCGGPNAVTFSVSISTNGPATVTYHLEIFNGDGTLRNKTENTNLVFTEYGTKTIDPGGAYKTDCGEYSIKVIVSVPNSITGKASWSVVSP